MPVWPGIGVVQSTGREMCGPAFIFGLYTQPVKSSKPHWCDAWEQLSLEDLVVVDLFENKAQYFLGCIFDDVASDAYAVAANDCWLDPWWQHPKCGIQQS